MNDALTLAPILYRARQTAFGLEAVRWNALQDCERERWRQIAARLTVTEHMTGKALFEAWAFDLFPKPWHEQPIAYRTSWQRAAFLVKYGDIELHDARGYLKEVAA